MVNQYIVIAVSVYIDSVVHSAVYDVSFPLNATLETVKGIDINHVNMYST